MIYNYIVYNKKTGKISTINQVIREVDMLIDKNDENDVLEVDKYDVTIISNYHVDIEKKQLVKNN